MKTSLRFLLLAILPAWSVTATAATNPISGLIHIARPASDSKIAIYTNNGSSSFGLAALTISNFFKASAVTNSLFVSPNGSDANPGTREFPFATLAAAKSAAIVGQTIFVGSGRYTNVNLLKAGVNWHFDAGSFVVWTNSSTGGSEDTHGMFDDRDAATTNIITGAGVFRRDGFTNVGFRGVVVITNPASKVSIECERLEVSTHAAIQGASGVHQKDGWLSVRCNEIVAPLTGQQVQIGEEDEEPVYAQPNESGITWELGELYVNVDHIGEMSLYGVWPTLPANSGTNVANFWLTAGIVEHYCYVSGLSTNRNWRSWWDVKELRGGLQIYNSGRHYIRAEKIGRNDNQGWALASVSTDPTKFTALEVWATVQKISSSSGMVKVETNTTMYLDCLEFEPIRAADGSAQSGNMIDQTGGTLWLRGLSGVVTNGLGLYVSAGTSYVEGLTMNVRGASATNFAVNVAGPAEVHLKGCTLLASSAASNTIYSASARTVGVYWTVGNKTNGVNVTISPNAGWYNDTGAK